MKTTTEQYRVGVPAEIPTGAITRFTASRPMGKAFELDASGNLVKRTLGEMTEGAYEVLQFGSAAELAAVLADTGIDQAISASTPVAGLPREGRIVTKRELANNPGAVARSKDYFGFAEAPGVMTLDYDPLPGETPKSRAELVEILLSVAPGLAAAGLLWWGSGSSFVRTTDGRELQGLRGQRLYILASNVAEIPAACDALAGRLWLAGYGRIVVSASGAKLDRHLFDDSMKQPARLDFAGGAVLGAGLVSGRGAPVVVQAGGFVSLADALPPLDAKDAARVEALKASARAKAEPEARAAREAHANRETPKVAARLMADGVAPGEAHERAAQVLAAAHGGVLMGDFEVTFEDGAVATVGAILDDRERFHGRITLDPLEPGYQNTKPVGRLYLFGAVPNLFSFAHGGRVYRLQRQPARVLLPQGRSQAAAAEIIGRLADDGDIFTLGGQPVRVAGGRAVPVGGKGGLAWLLESRLAFFKPGAKGGEVPADVPPPVVDRVLEGIVAEGDAHGIRPLAGVVDRPFATPDGAVDRVGRDAVSRVFADFDPCELDAVPVKPCRADLVNALRTLWGPWSAFPYATEHDRAGMLAAIFTALCRPGLDIAPGVLIEAPTQGTGKTLVAESLGALVTGRVPGLLPFSGSDDIELRKQVIADAVEGASVFIIDNVIGFFDSPTLAALTTGAAIRGRILGQSSNYAGEPRMLPILTGNNATLGPDFASRLIRIRLDAQTECPQARRFAFHPTRRVLGERWALLRAFVVLMRGFFAAGAPTGSGMSRFGQWTALVAGVVEWLRDEGVTLEAGVGAVGEPCHSLSGSAPTVVDLRTEGFRRLAAAMVRGWGSQPFEARELLPFLSGTGGGLYADEVRDALEAMMPERWKPNAINIARCLSDWRDNIAAGVVLRKEDRGHHAAVFRWVPVAG